MSVLKPAAPHYWPFLGLLSLLLLAALASSAPVLGTPRNESSAQVSSGNQCWTTEYKTILVASERPGQYQMPNMANLTGYFAYISVHAAFGFPQTEVFASFVHCNLTSGASCNVWGSCAIHDPQYPCAKPAAHFVARVIQRATYVSSPGWYIYCTTPNNKDGCIVNFELTYCNFAADDAHAGCWARTIWASDPLCTYYNNGGGPSVASGAHEVSDSHHANMLYESPPLPGSVN